MLKLTTICSVVYVLSLFCASDAFGQLTVQQPVMQSIGGQFAVSIPDRGGIILGSVSRAGESRASYGFPFTRGSSVGRFTQRSSLSSHVWIHDLREMDRLILQMAESGVQDTSTSPQMRRLGLAWTEFQPRRGVSISDRRPASFQVVPNARYLVLAPAGRSSMRTRSAVYDRERAPATPPKKSTSSRSRVFDPARSLRLGVEAEKSGNLTIAKLHYGAAARLGSAEATLRLRKLDSRPVIAASDTNHVTTPSASPAGFGNRNRIQN